MTELATRDEDTLADPTGGRLVAWAQAARSANQLAKALSKTSFVPKDFKGNEDDTTAAIIMGDELGLSPLAALRSLYVIHGSPAMYARAMVALVQSRGHEVWTELSTESKVVVHGQRKGSAHVETSEWTIARAQKAKYTSNVKYASNPQEMLYAKAASEVCRKVAADVLAGIPYSVEDLELDADQPTTTVKRAERVTTARRAPAQAVPEPSLDEPVTEPTEESLAELNAEANADAAELFGSDE